MVRFYLLHFGFKYFDIRHSCNANYHTEKKAKRKIIALKSDRPLGKQCNYLLASNNT